MSDSYDYDRVYRPTIREPKPALQGQDAVQPHDEECECPQCLRQDELDDAWARGWNAAQSHNAEAERRREDAVQPATGDWPASVWIVYGEKEGGPDFAAPYRQAAMEHALLLSENEEGTRLFGPWKVRQYVAASPHAGIDRQRDAERFAFWFRPEAKRIDVHAYLKGVTERWDLDRWRAFVDAAMATQAVREDAAAPLRSEDAA